MAGRSSVWSPIRTVNSDASFVTCPLVTIRPFWASSTQPLPSPTDCPWESIPRICAVEGFTEVMISEAVGGGAASSSSPPIAPVTKSTTTRMAMSTPAPAIAAMIWARLTDLRSMMRSIRDGLAGAPEGGEAAWGAPTGGGAVIGGGAAWGGGVY